MRFVWLAFVGLLVAMAFLVPWLNRPTTTPVAAIVTTPVTAVTLLRDADPRAAEIVAFGLAQRGTPYVYAGTSPLTGFDCSGFIMYTFAHFGVAVPHSTALLIDVGRPVARTEAQAGDIVVFTGTAESSTTPGHAGIIISGRGEVPLRFVHASSARRESGVKVSQIEGTDYERRFMQVRRVLGSALAPMARATMPAQPPAAGAVANLPSRAIPVAAYEIPPMPPTILKPRLLPSHSYTRKRTVAVHKAPIKPGTVVVRKGPAKKTVARTMARHTEAAKPVIKKPLLKKKSLHSR